VVVPLLGAGFDFVALAEELKKLDNTILQIISLLASLYVIAMDVVWCVMIIRHNPRFLCVFQLSYAGRVTGVLVLMVNAILYGALADAPLALGLLLLALAVLLAAPLSILPTRP